MSELHSLCNITLSAVSFQLSDTESEAGIARCISNSVIDDSAAISVFLSGFATLRKKFEIGETRTLVTVLG
jgi:hypothetical protein